jgi:hypothetical protein
MDQLKEFSCSGCNYYFKDGDGRVSLQPTSDGGGWE